MSHLEDDCYPVNGEHRKKFGQFFTHQDVAKFMTEWVLQSGQTNIYDPAFGLGAFYYAIQNSQYASQNINFYGSEIDSTILKTFQSKQKSIYPLIHLEDYLLAWGKRHQNIVCNPPYMGFQKFENREKAAQLFQENLQIQVSGYINISSAFLLKSISEMDGTGRLAYIMPLEFLSTNYGTLVKQNLIVNQHLVSIIKLNCEKEVFPNVTTSIGIILYDSSRRYDAVNFYDVNDINLLQNFAKLIPTNIISTNILNPHQKWISYFQNNDLKVKSNALVALSKYGKFSRGIATGANEFFILKPSEIKYNSLLESEYLPCISKSSQIKRPIFDPDDYQQLVARDSSVYLFNANENHSESADRYIQYGVSQQFDQRYLTKNRNPWYKTEKREPSRLLLGVFSRGGYKVILNRSKALNLTCFHGFYPNFLGAEQIEKLFLYLSSDVGRQIVSLSMRKYGDNLDKFEPNDLNTALVPALRYFEQMPIDLVKEAIATIEKTGVTPKDINTYFASILR